MVAQCASPADLELERRLWEEVAREHALFEEDLADAVALARQGSLAHAARKFGEFRLEVERHVRDEEELLSVIEEMGLLPERIQQLREGHAGLRGLIQQVSDALSRWELAAFERALRTLERALKAHQDEERELVLPTLASCLPDRATYQQLLRKLTTR